MYSMFSIISTVLSASALKGRTGGPGPRNFSGSCNNSTFGPCQAGKSRFLKTFQGLGPSRKFEPCADAVR